MSRRVERPRKAMPGRRRGRASWLTAAAPAGLFVVGVSSAASMPGIGAALLIAGSFALLGAAGWAWGADTRDGADWKDRPPGSIR